MRAAPKRGHRHRGAGRGVGSGEGRAGASMALPRLRNSTTSGNPVPDHYKWIALSNTTLGVLIATINASILLISLPDIFRGIGINPLLPSNTSYLLWLILGLPRRHRGARRLARPPRRHLRPRADVQPRLRRVHGLQRPAVGDVAEGQLRRPVADPDAGPARASAARCCSRTRARSSPTRSRQEQRGLALGINGVAAVAGSSIGLVLGGVLAPVALARRVPGVGARSASSARSGAS